MGFNPFKFVLGLAIVAVGYITHQGWIASIGISMSASAFGPSLRDAVNTFQSRNIDPQNAVPVIYGKAKVATIPAGYPVASIGSSVNDSLFVPGIVCHGSENGQGIEAFHEAQLDGTDAIADSAVDTTAGGWEVTASPPVDAFYSGAFRYTRLKGKATQGVPAVLTAHFPTEFPATSSFAGLAMIVARYESDKDVFRARPRLTTVVSGAHVFDTRTSTWGFSVNPALCVLDQLMSRTYGRGLPISKIDTASFDAAADYCEEQITDPDTTRDRFTCNGVVDTELNLETRLTQLLSSCNGSLIKQEETYRIVIRQTQAAASFTITERDVVGDILWKQQGPNESGNAAHLAFVNPDQDYQIDVVQWPAVGSADEATLLAEDNGVSVPVAVDLPFTNNQYMAMRIGREKISEGRNADTLVLTLREQYIEFEVGDIITIDLGLLGSDGPMDCWVIAMTIGADVAGLVQCVFQKYHAAAYTAPTFTALPSPPTIGPPDPTTSAPPTTLAVTAATSGVAGEVILTATWVAPANGISRYELEYDDSSGFVRVAPDPAASVTTFVWSIGSPASASVDVRLRSINTHGVPSTYATDTVTLTAGGGLPQPSGLVTHGTQTGTFNIDWSLGDQHTLTGGATALTITFSNYAAGMHITLKLTAGAGAITLPSTKYPNGTTPASPISGETDRYGWEAFASAAITDVEGLKLATDSS